MEGGEGCQRCGRRIRPSQGGRVILERGGRGGLPGRSRAGHLPCLQCCPLEEEGNIGVENLRFLGAGGPLLS